MDSKQTDKMEPAVQACLKIASASQTPFTAIGSFVDQLRSDPSWPRDELFDLQRTVFKRLYQSHLS